jgi:DNA-binding IclR family transcriptional regulator
MSAEQLASASDVNPAAIVDAMLGFHKTAALKAAIELDLFTAIAAGSDTPELLAGATGSAERGVRILGDFLTAHGFLTKDGARYRLTPSSQVFLDRKSPQALCAMAARQASPILRRIIRSG